MDECKPLPVSHSLACASRWFVGSSSSRNPPVIRGLHSSTFSAQRKQFLLDTLVGDTLLVTKNRLRLS